MRISLTDEDKKTLPRRGFKTAPDLDGVEIIDIPGFSARDWAKKFLIRRGIQEPILYESIVAEFKHVGMHIDALSPISACSLIVMLKGEGQLSYTWPDSTIDNTELKKGDAFAFNFHAPHSWFTRSRGSCMAVIVDVDREQIKSLSKTKVNSL